MTKSKKVSSIIASFALISILLFGLVLTGCGAPKQVEDATKVHTATITNWYEQSGTQRLDTSININFDKLNIKDIDRITFELYQGEDKIADAVSEGENLVTLFKDCAQYWGKTAATYLDIKGDRTISSAFSTRIAPNDNGFWVRSACALTSPNLPSKLVVKVLADNVEYVSSVTK